MRDQTQACPPDTAARAADIGAPSADAAVVSADMSSHGQKLQAEKATHQPEWQHQFPAKVFAGEGVPTLGGPTAGNALLGIASMVGMQWRTGAQLRTRITTT